MKYILEGDLVLLENNVLFPATIEHGVVKMPIGTTYSWDQKSGKCLSTQSSYKDIIKNYGPAFNVSIAQFEGKLNQKHFNRIVVGDTTGGSLISQPATVYYD